MIHTLTEPRLLAVAELLGVTPRVADIGTDHGYLPIHLIQDRLAEHVLATDVSKSSLRRAQVNTCAYEQIETRLSDGFAAIASGECDAAVLAGIGGNTVSDILRAGTSNIPTLVIQPMGYADRVRSTLISLGYGITGEKLIREGRRFYFVMRAELGKGFLTLTQEEIEFGPCLLRERNETLLSFLDRELARFARQKDKTEKLDSVLQHYEEVKQKWFVP